MCARVGGRCEHRCVLFPHTHVASQTGEFLAPKAREQIHTHTRTEGHTHTHTHTHRIRIHTCLVEKQVLDPKAHDRELACVRTTGGVRVWRGF